MSAAGRKRGPGRPAKPQEEVLTVQLGVHVTADEAELIRKATEVRGARSVSAWAREVLRRAARAAVEAGTSPAPEESRGPDSKKAAPKRAARR